MLLWGFQVWLLSFVYYTKYIMLTLSVELALCVGRWEVDIFFYLRSWAISRNATLVSPCTFMMAVKFIWSTNFTLLPFFSYLIFNMWGYIRKFPNSLAWLHNFYFKSGTSFLLLYFSSCFWSFVLLLSILSFLCLLVVSEFVALPLSPSFRFLLLRRLCAHTTSL